MLANRLQRGRARVGGGEVAGGMVATVAVVTIDAHLPVDIFLDRLSGEIETEHVGSPKILLRVAHRTEVFLGRHLGTACRRRGGGSRPSRAFPTPPMTQH